MTNLVAILSSRTSRNIFQPCLFSNGRLFTGFFLSLLFLAVGCYWPACNRAFYTLALSLRDWYAISLGAGLYLLLPEGPKGLRPPIGSS
ncbi:cation transporting ATPase C-terminal domain-containing protein [Paraflavisolibacter sp. H34]|uniref:cation transporting ATPase C-terminal domain-containing protein n=1 Tax=Huijunlia imazamoxiresistens TaxID=3127457 RepID=UPI0030168368